MEEAPWRIEKERGQEASVVLKATEGEQDSFRLCRVSDSHVWQKRKQWP